MAILAYNEAKINTRKRNIAGYILFCASTFSLIVVSISNSLMLFLCPWRAAIHLTLVATWPQLDLATSGQGGIGPFIGICAIVGAFGVADAHVQGGMVGDLSFMCPDFIQVRLDFLIQVISFSTFQVVILMNG